MTNFIPNHDYYKVGRTTWYLLWLIFFHVSYVDVKIEIMTKLILLSLKNLL